jgi:hypothetical protein
MVVVLNLSSQMMNTRCGYVILRFAHHPRVGFVSQNSLYEDVRYILFILGMYPTFFLTRYSRTRRKVRSRWVCHS